MHFYTPKQTTKKQLTVEEMALQLIDQHGDYAVQEAFNTASANVWNADFDYWYSVAQLLQDTNNSPSVEKMEVLKKFSALNPKKENQKSTIMTEKDWEKIPLAVAPKVKPYIPKKERGNGLPEMSLSDYLASLS